MSTIWQRYLEAESILVASGIVTKRAPKPKALKPKQTSRKRISEDRWNKLVSAKAYVAPALQLNEPFDTTEHVAWIKDSLEGMRDVCTAPIHPYYDISMRCFLASIAGYKHSRYNYKIATNVYKYIYDVDIPVKGGRPTFTFKVEFTPGFLSAFKDIVNGVETSQTSTIAKMVQFLHDRDFVSWEVLDDHTVTFDFAVDDFSWLHYSCIYAPVSRLLQAVVESEGLVKIVKPLGGISDSLSDYMIYNLVKPPVGFDWEMDLPENYLVLTDPYDKKIVTCYERAERTEVNKAAMLNKLWR